MITVFSITQFGYKGNKKLPSYDGFMYQKLSYLLYFVQLLKINATVIGVLAHLLYLCMVN